MSIKTWQGELETKFGELIQVKISYDEIDGKIVVEKKINNEFVIINPLSLDIFSVLREFLKNLER